MNVVYKHSIATHQSTNMKKVLLIFLTIATIVLGEVAPYPPSGTRPQGALLVLPPQYGTPGNFTPDSRSQNASESLEKVNEQIMEKLRQVEGSERGVYHVYLPNGRLQRVQYTSAPLKSTNQPSSQNTNSFQYNQQNSQGFSQQYNQQNAQGFSQQYNQEEQASPQIHYVSIEHLREQLAQNYNQRSAQLNSGYLPPTREDNFEPRQNGISNLPGQFAQLKAISIDELREYLTQENQEGQSQRYAETGNKPSGYLASIQYDDVPPVKGPIYSYNPAPLTRVLRTA